MIFNQLVDRYRTTLYKVAMGKKCRFISPEEANQLVLIELWKYSLNPQEVRNLGAFLNVVVSRRILNTARASYRYHDHEQMPVEGFNEASSPQDIEGEYISAREYKEMMVEVQSLLPKIPERLQESVSLRLSGLPLKDIGTRIGISAQHAGVNVSRGAIKLQEVLYNENNSQS